MRQRLLCGAVYALGFGLSACGGQPSAVPPSGGQQSTIERGQYAAPANDGANYAARSDADVPKVDGKPMWASNRKHTAEENAQYQFTKNGGDFGASNENDYVAKAHAFIDHPPTGVQTVDRRNGDRLIYDAKDNIFAVVSREGAPRTMFKPRGGASYWTQQKDRESQRSTGRSSGAGDQSQG